MTRKAFTLVEVLMGLFILALVSVTTLPIVNVSFLNFSKQKTRSDMVYNCEMAMERLKAYNSNSKDDFSIFNKPVGEIIDSFNLEDNVKLDLEDGNYRLVIEKKDQSDSLWFIHIKLYNIKGGGDEYVELKAYIPKS